MTKRVHWKTNWSVIYFGSVHVWRPHIVYGKKSLARHTSAARPSNKQFCKYLQEDLVCRKKQTYRARLFLQVLSCLYHCLEEYKPSTTASNARLVLFIWLTIFIHASLCYMLQGKKIWIPNLSCHALFHSAVRAQISVMTKFCRFNKMYAIACMVLPKQWDWLFHASSKE